MHRNMGISIMLAGLGMLLGAALGGWGILLGIILLLAGGFISKKAC